MIILSRRSTAAPHISQAIQHVFQKSGYNYTKKTALTHSAWLLGGPGIVAVVGGQCLYPAAARPADVRVLGKDHQRHRKIMNPAFSAAHLRTFLPLFQRIAGKV